MKIGDLERLLSSWTKELKGEDQKVLMARLSTLKSVFPFNEYEYRLMFLFDKKMLSFEDYEELRNNYVGSHPYLDLYGLAPRVFGEVWAHKHLMDIDSRFKKPGKSIDPKYEGQYDLWVEGVKVEVQTCRAIKTKVQESIVSKALHYDDKAPFWMNFQQIKPDLCDMFVFLGVWVDRICYWLLTNDEVRNHPDLSHQHRGGIEYQIGVTQKNLRQFDRYLVKPADLVEVILKKRKKKR